MTPTKILVVALVCLTISTFQQVLSAPVGAKQPRRFSPQCKALMQIPQYVSLEKIRSHCGDAFQGKVRRQGMASLPAYDDEDEVQPAAIHSKETRDVDSYNSERSLLKRLANLLAARYKTERRREVSRSTEYPDEIPSFIGEPEVVKESLQDQYYYGADGPMYLIRKWYENIPRND